MWEWTCPGSGIVWVHHSKRGALEMIAIHKRGLTPPGFPNNQKCSLEHGLVDTGEPCTESDCKIPYLRDVV